MEKSGVGGDPILDTTYMYIRETWETYKVRGGLYTSYIVLPCLSLLSITNV